MMILMVMMILMIQRPPVVGGTKPLAMIGERVLT